MVILSDDRGGNGEQDFTGSVQQQPQSVDHTPTTLSPHSHHTLATLSPHSHQILITLWIIMKGRVAAGSAESKIPQADLNSKL